MRWLLFFLPILAAALWLLPPRGAVSVSVAGDLAPDLRSVLADRVGGFVSDPAEAQVEIIAVTRWDKLPFVPGAVRDCGAGCAVGSGLTVVRVLAITPRGARKQVFVNIGRFLSDAGGTTFVLSEAGRACLAAGLRQEAARLRGAVWPEACAPAGTLGSRIRFGLS